MAPLSKLTLLAIVAALATSAFAAPAAVGKRVGRKEIAAVVPNVPSTALSGQGQPVAVLNKFTDAPVNQLQAALDFVSSQISSNTFGSYIVKDSYVTKHNGSFPTPCRFSLGFPHAERS
jgi:hypothetical protein